MIVYVFRHAEAFPEGEEGITSDFERFLTPKGQLQAQRSGKALRKLDARPTIILTSPLIRARQTAERAQEELGKQIPIEVCPELAWPADLDAVTQRLATFHEDDEVVVVGHQPDLGRLVTRLAFQGLDMGVWLKKSGVAALRIVRDNDLLEGELLWVMTSRHLRLIAKKKTETD